LLGQARDESQRYEERMAAAFKLVDVLSEALTKDAKLLR
jgi:hypothetical protein